MEGFENLPQREKREAERRKAHLGNGRGLFPGLPGNRGTRQRLSASRRGDFFDPGTVLPARGEACAMIPKAFALSLQSRPAIEGSAPLVGPDDYPRPPESVLARHSR